MSKELVISANRHETRVALIEDDQLVEVYFQRANEYSLAGSIHKGRVTRVLPGMQSAFVDVGLERDTFLYVTDFLEEHEDIDRVTGDEPLPQPRRGGRDRDERGRDGRGGRDNDRSGRDNDRAPQSQPAPVATAGESRAAEDETPANDAGSPEANSAAPAAPAERPVAAPGEKPPERPLGERGDDRDRHGRRSRRRRSRGRGFPDAKYAGAPGPGARGNERGGGPLGSQEGEAPQHMGQPTDRRTEEPSDQHTRGDARYFETETRTEPPLILPGESLAKYRGAPASEALRTGEPGRNAIDHDRAASGNSEARGESIAEAPAAPAVVESDVVENEFDEPSHYPPENALPDAPAHTPPALTTEGQREPQEVATAVRAPGTPPPLPYMTAPDIVHSDVAHNVSPDVNGVEDDIEAEEAEGGPATAPMLDEDEDRDIQEMILSHTEGLDSEVDLVDESDEAESAGEETAGEGTSENGASGNDTARDEANPGEARTGPENGAAQVRERGGRYPHRGMSRRTRRRGRGGQEPHGGDRTGERPPERTGEQRTVSRPISALPSGTPLITDLLKEGQEIIVQIAKEPLGQKGARITSHIALPGRYVVFMPTLQHMGVSRKISSDEERLRLKRILQGRRPGPLGGFITRTAAEGRTEEEIASDMAFLYNLWMDIRNKAEKRPAPVLLHHDLDIVQRILRDQLADNFKAIWIDNEDTYVSVLRFVEQFQPGLVGKVKLYTREAPIFDAFNVTAELEKALRPKVWLKSGGFIVINQTEALVAIDVNTGKYVGKTNRLEDTIVKTNTEAIKEIVRQVRLRDLGGIIVIDFIDMDERKNRQKVMQVLEEAMRVDRAPYKILQFNDFGLVAITRKRVKQSLERTLCSPCPHCDGAGYIKSVQTVVNEILTEARKMAASVEGKDVMLRVHPDVAKVLKSNQNKYLEELEEVLRRPVLVRSDAQLHHEKFDLA
jgi:ribonuclease G